MDRRHIKALLACSLISYSTISLSDDSEIFFSKDLSTTKPNIVFLLDTSGSMTMSLGTNRDRMEVLKESLENILTSPDIRGVRAGIMTFASVTRQIQEVIDLNDVDPSKDVNKESSTSNAGYTILNQRILMPHDDGYQLPYTTGSSSRPVLTTTTYNSSLNRDTIFAYRFDNILLNNLNTASVPSTNAIKKAELILLAPTSPVKEISANIYVDSADNAPRLKNFINFIRERFTASGSTPLKCTKPDTTQHLTCDVTDIIKSKISQPNWVAGNAITFYITEPTNKANTLLLHFHESTTTSLGDNKPLLKIEAHDSVVTENNKNYGDLLLDKVYALNANGGTAVVGAMYDAARYVSNVPLKANPGPFHNTVWGESPLLEGCQLTHLVVMTDGEAGTAAYAQVAPYIGIGGQSAGACKIFTDSVGTTIDEPKVSAAERCGRALTSWMARYNQSNLEGGNFIRTHSIGFTLTSTGSGQKFIDDIATYGMGKSYNASNATELTEAFKDIVNSALIVDSPSTSGQVTMSPESRYKQRNEAYYALYKSENYDYWPGNMKGFQISYIEATLTDGSKGQRAVLRDKNGNSALGADGVIKDTASSFWSTSDGGNVDEGGVVALLKYPNLRNVFTINGSATEPLSASANVTNADLQLSGNNQDDVRKGLLNFIRGYKYVAGGGTDENAKKIGDSAKSGVSLATYGCSTGEDVLKCNFSNLSQVALLASNDGFIRGFDTVTGENLYEYMPKEMLPIIKHLQARKTLSMSEVRNYGMDGDITIYHDDKNEDGYINKGEDAFAYVASGRGGSYLYAINIQDKSTPKLAWMISNKTSGFGKLGDTWSKPVAGKINIGGTLTPVLIFGGGYDKSQDDNPARHTNTVGNALYIVNAKTGSLIWSTSANMDYSIPGAVAVVTEELDTMIDPDDPNNEKDSFITDIFFGDMGGQLWRFQVNNGSPTNSLIVAGGGDNGIVAKFADNSLKNSRRFYYAPVVSKFKSKEYQDTLAVSIGSGYRAHPLSTDIEDRIYSLRLPLQADLTSGKVLTESDLAVTSIDGQTLGSSDNLKNGFYIRLGVTANSAGEKVVSAAYADFERIVFNTYIPTKTVSKNCVPGSGTQRTYNYAILTGESLLSTPYEQTSVSTLPPDVTAYCNGKFCTIVSGPGFLSEESELSKGKNGVDPWISSVGQEGAWEKIGWTDHFSPIIN